MVVVILSHLDSSSFETNLSSETAQKFQKVRAQEEHNHDVNTPCSISQLCKTIDTSTESTCIETTCNETSLYRKDRF